MSSQDLDQRAWSSHLGLWHDVAHPILETLNALELPGPDPDQKAPAAAAAAGTTTAARAAQAAAAAPAEPEPSGDGVDLLRQIVDVVRERPDHEQLLSAVLRTAQSRTAAAPLRTWVADNLDTLLGSMTSATRRALHALDGLAHDTPHRAAWAALLPNAPRTDQHPINGLNHDTSEDTGEDTHPAGEEDIDFDELVNAASHLLEDLIRDLQTAPTKSLPALVDLATKVAGWTYATPNDLARTLSIVVADSLAAIGWAHANTDDEAGQGVWARKQALLDLIKALALPTTPTSSAPDNQDEQDPLEEWVYTRFADDLAAMLTAQAITEYAITSWRTLATQLPAPAARALSDQVDAYEPTEGEEGAVLRFKLTVRTVADLEAPPAADIINLPATEQTTDLIDAWLDLRPTSKDAQTVLTTTPATNNALRRYSGTLNTDDRTNLWLALRAANIENRVLVTVGAAGIGADAVTAVATDIRAAQRGPDRADHLRQLLDTQPDADTDTELKKAASDLAHFLLDKDTTGDFRSAVDLVLWAGGAGRGHVQALRQRFNAGSNSQKKALPNGVWDRLAAQNLMAPRTKKRSLFGL